MLLCRSSCVMDWRWGNECCWNRNWWPVSLSISVWWIGDGVTSVVEIGTDGPSLSVSCSGLRGGSKWKRQCWNGLCIKYNSLTLLVGCQGEHPACKNEWWFVGVVICLQRGANCLYGPADATAVPKLHNLLPHLNPDWFYLSDTGLPRLPSVLWRC